MQVVGIGDVEEFCRRRGWRVAERFSGDPMDYRGRGTTLVWGGYHKLFEFYYVRFRLLRRGIQLVATQDYGDMGYVLDQFVVYMAQREAGHHGGGRTNFGWRLVNGEKIPVPEELRIADRVILLRESGMSFRSIADRLAEEGVKNQAGTEIGVSTIARIWKRKELYRGEQ